MSQGDARNSSGPDLGSEELEQRLAGLQRGFRADGYELRVEAVAGDHAAVSIVAGPKACEECLVPKPVMEAILLRALDGSGVRRITLRYPTDPAE